MIGPAGIKAIETKGKGRRRLLVSVSSRTSWWLKREEPRMAETGSLGDACWMRRESEREQ